MSDRILPSLGHPIASFALNELRPVIQYRSRLLPTIEPDFGIDRPVLHGRLSILDWPLKASAASLNATQP